MPYRIASAPYVSMMSSGSTPFPFDFDIVSPNPSSTFGWTYTCLKGMSPTLNNPVITIRATQRVMMSRLVTSVLVG